MSVKWILREVLAQRGFTTASEISRVIQERNRYSISTQAVCDLLNDEPKMLRIETARPGLGLRARAVVFCSRAMPRCLSVQMN